MRSGTQLSHFLRVFLPTLRSPHTICQLTRVFINYYDRNCGKINAMGELKIAQIAFKYITKKCYQTTNYDILE